jgi:hypothetical protein
MDGQQGDRKAGSQVRRLAINRLSGKQGGRPPVWRSSRVAVLQADRPAGWQTIRPE